MSATAVVVDDEPAIVEVVCEALADAGIHTEPCYHGNEAYSYIRRAQPGVVILDIQMHGHDGIEVFRQMRGDPITAAIPVIFFTANSQKLLERLPNYRELGAVLLPKPFNITRLVTLVEQALAGTA